MADTSNVDLLALVQENTTLRRTASTRGGEWKGPCPFCGGTDRFWVHPNASPPEWRCRGCEKGGDAITYIRERDGIGYREACSRLGVDPGSRPTTTAPRRAVAENDDPPSPTWQEHARALVAYAEAQLWSEAGASALAYLREQRGLTDETIRRAHLGYLPKSTEDRAERWGIETDDGRLWIPRGVVIPCEIGPTVWYVKIRRPLPPDRDGKIDALAEAIGADRSGPKYQMIAGSKPALFGADSLADHAAAILAEGEFDALLLEQVAGDVVGVATLGSAKAGISERWVWALLPVSPILAAYDLDTTGQDGAVKLAQLSARIQIAKPLAHDLTAMQQEGGDLRAWVLAHVAPTTQREEPRPEPERAFDNRWLVDPRADLDGDHGLWVDALTLAYTQDGKDPAGLYGALHGLRCLGARLERRGATARLNSGDMVDEYADLRERWLTPHHQRLVDLLRRVGAPPASRKPTEDPALVGVG